MRKVLSFVLVLTLVLSSFSMAFAATPAAAGLSDITGNANEEAIQVVYDLGIVTGTPEGTFQPTKAVNRAEFAAMITRALGVPDSALAGYSTTTFKDTTGYGWAVPYLAFCNSKGIMLGDGAGNVMPGRTINTNEAVTMVLRAVGYTNNSSELVGTWPSNYVTKAQDLGIYDDVATATNVDKANAAQMIYNALTVQKVAVNTDGDTQFLDNGKTGADYVAFNLLNTGLGCDADDDAIVEGTEESLINLMKYVGQHGTLYTNDDDEVVAFISDSTELIGKIDTTDNKVFTTTVGEVDYTTTQAITAAYAGATSFVNGESGKAVTSTDELVLNVKLSGKKIVEIYSVLDWQVTNDDQVDAAALKDITEDESLLGSDFVLDDDDNIDPNTFILKGVASLDKIAADDIVYVYENSDNEITKIEVGTETVTGTVESWNSNTKFYIGSTKYKNAETMVNNVQNFTSIGSGDVADEVTASLDVNGYVYTFEATDGGNKNVAIVEKYANGIDDQIKIFTSEGTSKVCTYDDAKITEAGASAGAVIAYSLNSSGKITDARFDTAAPLLISGTAMVFKSNSVATVEGTDYPIASDVVVFTQDTDGDYHVSTIDKVKKNEAAVNGSVLLNADNNKVVGILVPSSAAKAASDSVFAVVNEVQTANLDGDKVDRIIGYAAGASIDKKADGQYLGYNEPTYTTNVAAFAADVDLYEIEMDADGVITSISARITDAHADYAVTSAALTGADGRNSVSTGAVIYALANNVVVYEVNSDKEYKLYNGSFKAKDVVVLYELDDDVDGYDLVILNRADRD